VLASKRRALLGLLLLWGLSTLAGPREGVPPPDVAAQSLPPPIGHVFLILLENENFDQTFGPLSPATFLTGTLVPQGQVLRQYFAIGHRSLDNYIGLVSGQAPNPDTQNDCTSYTDFSGSTIDANGQAVGRGCVYPPAITTIADQLEAAGLTWKAYMEDMGNIPARESATCAHPPIGSADRTQTAQSGDQYATKHNPYVYFHSIIDSPSCDANDVSLGQLTADLASVGSTPNYAFISPNLCNDGHDHPCIDGSPGGLVSADAFLKRVVPQILDSPGFSQDGLLAILFDEADTDSSACCNEPTGPNTTSPGLNGPGGGRPGALLISPFIAPGSVNDTPYNHYALLRSVEDIFGLAHLGFASQDGLSPFGVDVYDSSGTPTPTSTSSATPTATSTRSPSPTVTRTPTRTPTPKPTKAPTKTPTPTPTKPPTKTPTPTRTPSRTPTPKAAATPTEAPTPP